ncbi:MAG: bifunctional adenosylcobinamide kinase/adenosylcobinamide-phosphate guanylyltransferase [Deltaproteobacteria bacterium]|nr:bifunctional adenosylcobinamide kinase/adenosylcobinamide-phosphate guanylyltransferase [Deltaproteobacteria bacterium]
MVIFITGGARSGKSDFAQGLAENIDGKRLFLATAQALDREMEERIRKHQEKRGDRWDTLEEPIALGDALRSVDDDYDVILIDCLTLWVSNLLMSFPEQAGRRAEIIDDFFSSIDGVRGTLIVTSNEVGQGIVPDNKIARIYRDKLGFLNQRMAKRADSVHVLFSGISVTIKG